MSAHFQALLSAQYHATKRMARAGELQQGGNDWLERVTRRERRGSRILRPLTNVDEAARLIGVPPNAARERTWRHVRAALAATHWVDHRHPPEVAPSADLGPILDKALPRGGTRNLLDPKQNQNALAAFVHGYSAPVPGLGSQVHPFQLQVNCAQLDASDVTIFDAQVTRKAPTGITLGQVAETADPRKWSQTFPELFAQTYEIQDPAACTDRYADPLPHGTGPPATKGFQGYLFEEATLGFIGRFRNLLHIELVLKPNKPAARIGQVNIAYSLHEPLSNTVLGFQRPGGFDVDSSDLIKHPCAIELVTSKGGNRTMVTQASKTLRFSEYAEFSDELNLLALPMLNLWVTSLLVNSVYL